MHRPAAVRSYTCSPETCCATCCCERGRQQSCRRPTCLLQDGLQLDRVVQAPPVPQPDMELEPAAVVPADRKVLQGAPHRQRRWLRSTGCQKAGPSSGGCKYMRMCRGPAVQRGSGFRSSTWTAALSAGSDSVAKAGPMNLKDADRNPLPPLLLLLPLPLLLPLAPSLPLLLLLPPAAAGGFTSPRTPKESRWKTRSSLTFRSQSHDSQARASLASLNSSDVALYMRGLRAGTPAQPRYLGGGRRSFASWVRTAERPRTGGSAARLWSRSGPCRSSATARQARDAQRRTRRRVPGGRR